MSTDPNRDELPSVIPFDDCQVGDWIQFHSNFSDVYYEIYEKFNTLVTYFRYSKYSEYRNKDSSLINYDGYSGTRKIVRATREEMIKRRLQLHAVSFHLNGNGMMTDWGHVPTNEGYKEQRYNRYVKKVEGK